VFLILAEEDGGQGLVLLASRCTAYHLKFVQKCMLGSEWLESERLVWRPVAQCILRGISGFGLNNVLFLMDSNKI